MKGTSVDKVRESEKQAYIEKGTKIHTNERRQKRHTQRKAQRYIQREGVKDTHIKIDKFTYTQS